MAVRYAGVLVYDHIPRISKRLQPAADKICGKWAFKVETDGKINVPVDTGALRASLQTEQEALARWVVYTNIEYAAYVEFGTVNMPPQPYLTPAAENARSGFIADMQNLEKDLA